MDFDKIAVAVGVAAAALILGYALQRVGQPSQTPPTQQPSTSAITGGTLGASYTSNVNGSSGASVSPTSNVMPASSGPCPF